MTYSTLPDFYFSSALLSIGFPILIILAEVLLLKLYSDNPLIKWMLILLFPLAFLLLLASGTFNVMFFGYGEPVEIVSIDHTEKELIVLDYLRTSGGKTSSGSKYYRAHILDPLSGKKIIRMLVGVRAEFLGIQGDTLIIANHRAVRFFSIQTGTEQLQYNRETLPTIFPVLAKGIQEIDWRWGGLYLTALDGTKWVVDPLTKTIRKDERIHDVYIPTNKLYLYRNEVLLDDREGGTEIVELKAIDGNDGILYITKEGMPSNKAQSFIEGNLVGMSTADSCLIIRHYTTTVKDEFIYTAVSLDGKNKQWEIKASSLNREASESKTDLTVDEKKGLLFFFYGKEVVAIKLKTGALVWRSKL